jgi:hypothetical protein
MLLLLPTLAPPCFLLSLSRQNGLIEPMDPKQRFGFCAHASRLMDFPRFPTTVHFSFYPFPMLSIVATMILVLPRKVVVGRRHSVIFLLMGMFGICGAFLDSTTISNPAIWTAVAPTKSTRRLACLKSGQNDDMGESSKHVDKTLGELLLPSENCKVDQMSGTDLAYIGDVVFELFIRSRHVWPSKRTSELQTIVVSTVRGKFTVASESLRQFGYDG